MGSMHCRLYDENLVHNIIMSTGITIAEFMHHHPAADADDICEYLELHADTIIEDTIEQLNTTDDFSEKDDNHDGIWPLASED